MMVKPEKMMNLAESIKSSHADGDTSGALQDVQDPVSDLNQPDEADDADPLPELGCMEHQQGPKSHVQQVSEVKHLQNRRSILVTGWIGRAEKS